MVIFTQGTRVYPSATWMLTAWTKLPYRCRKQLKRLLVVHPSGWSKFILQAMAAVISSKFAKKLLWIENIAQLAAIKPIPNFHIPESIHAYDATVHVNPFAPKMFGVDPSQLLYESGSHGLPRVIIDCCEFIEHEGFIS